MVVESSNFETLRPTERGIARAAIEELGRLAPELDLSVALARAMLDDTIREGRLLVERHKKAAEATK